MPIANLTDQQLGEFLRNGVLHQTLIVPIVCLQESIKLHSQDPLSSLEQSVYDKVIDDLAQVAELLSNHNGIPIEQCPINTPLQGTNGYVLERISIYDHNVLHITRPALDDFYWRVAIRDSGKPDSTITGYYHGCSSGNLNDIKNAYSNTAHLFPSLGCKIAESLKTDVSFSVKRKLLFC